MEKSMHSALKSSNLFQNERCNTYLTIRKLSYFFKTVDTSNDHGRGENVRPGEEGRGYQRIRVLPYRLNIGAQYANYGGAIGANFKLPLKDI